MQDDPAPDRRFLTVSEADGTSWRIDAGFLGSRWRCLWGCGCQGIEDVAAPQLQLGCCSVGVVLADEEEAMTLDALAATLDPSQFEQAAEARAGGIFADRSRRATRVVDGACIFLNRPGFPGGAGCALHVAALAEGDDPLDWKPLTCGRLPLRVEERRVPDGTATFELRAWRRDDWGPGGATMAWWCTEAPEAFDADRPVLRSLESELRRALGDDLYEQVAELIEGPAGPEVS